MSIFSSLKQYNVGKWEVVKTEDFSKEDIAEVTLAVVVASQYGNSVEFTLTRGVKTYIPLSQNSTLGTGEEVDLLKAKLITLHKEGAEDILRIEI